MKKYIILSCSFICFSYTIVPDSKNDFDNKLTEIATEFRLNVFDKDKCCELKNKAGAIQNDIESELRLDEYSSTELTELKKLRDEAEAIEEFIASVEDCASYIPTIEQFYLANKRIKGDVVYVAKDKFCVDFIKISINNYVCYLCENSSPNNFTIYYNWKALNGTSKGKGDMGMASKSVRTIYNNRDKHSQVQINIFGVSCVPL